MGRAPSTRANARGGRSREVEDGRRVGNNQIGQGGWGGGGRSRRPALRPSEGGDGPQSA